MGKVHESAKQRQSLRVKIGDVLKMKKESDVKFKNLTSREGYEFQETKAGFKVSDGKGNYAILEDQGTGMADKTGKTPNNVEFHYNGTTYSSLNNISKKPKVVEALKKFLKGAQNTEFTHRPGARETLGMIRGARAHMDALSAALEKMPAMFTPKEREGISQFPKTRNPQPSQPPQRSLR